MCSIPAKPFSPTYFSMDSDNLDSYIAGKLEHCRGEWEWNEELKNLQFMSSIPGHKPKTSNKKTASTTPPPLTVKPSLKPKLESVITIEDVKSVAVGLISQKSVMAMSFKATALFDRWYKAEEFDYLLWCVLLYCKDFLEINDPVSTHNTCQSFLGPEERSQTQSEQENQLGQQFATISLAYSYFLLNDIRSSESKVDEKRYASFRERLFSKHTDQMAFEVLYEFVMRVVWITFGYRDWELIQREIGKVFKTSAFNKVIPEDNDHSEIEDQHFKNKSRPYSASWCSSKPMESRPSISSVRTMRSPAIAGLFPTPQEKSSHLLSRKPHHLSEESKIFLPTTISPPGQLGIIGDKLHKYDMKTLKLLHVEKNKQSRAASRPDLDRTVSGLSGDRVKELAD